MGQVLLGRRFSDSKTLLFGYRRLEVDFEGAGLVGRIDADVDIDGFGVGIRFEF